MKLSVVATLYCSAPYVAEFCDRASRQCRALAGDDHEIVLVDDGSPDESLRLAIDASRRDPHVRVVELSRNFGHHKAMLAGLSESRGNLVFLVDSDLEEEPEWLAEFAAAMRRDGCDVVYGVQADRKGGWFERWSGGLFYRVFHLLTGHKIPANMVTGRLMTRAYVDALLLHRERESDIGGLWHITGFDQRPCTVRKHCTSATTYTIGRKVSLFVNSITSFSSAPLVAMFWLGAAVAALAAVAAAWTLASWLATSEPVSGWTSLVLSVWFFGGLNLACLGLVGIYVGKVFLEVKQRPNWIVKARHGSDG
jgi:putative glycosyltransferase